MAARASTILVGKLIKCPYPGKLSVGEFPLSQRISPEILSFGDNVSMMQYASEQSTLRLQQNWRDEHPYHTSTNKEVVPRPTRVGYCRAHEMRFLWDKAEAEDFS